MNGKGVNGGTTIAGTMVLAHLAGIKVFATGGLGTSVIPEIQSGLRIS
jgi:pseudouridine-5'-phosphate glycosidase